VRTIDDWLAEYNESHQHPGNKLLHWFCVPLIVVSLIGLLCALPVPGSAGDLPLTANWGVLIVLATLCYYFLLSPLLALGMVIIAVLVLAAVSWLNSLATHMWMICAVIFGVSWIGQFWGHVLERKSPSFFKDVQFLMIGPLWLLAHTYRRLGIRY